jgi:hypothetical protein
VFNLHRRIIIINPHSPPSNYDNSPPPEDWRLLGCDCFTVVYVIDQNIRVCLKVLLIFLVFRAFQNQPLSIFSSDKFNIQGVVIDDFLVLHMSFTYPTSEPVLFSNSIRLQTIFPPEAKPTATTFQNYFSEINKSIHPFLAQLIDHVGSSPSNSNSTKSSTPSEHDFFSFLLPPKPTPITATPNNPTPHPTPFPSVDPQSLKRKKTEIGEKKHILPFRHKENGKNVRKHPKINLIKI